MQGPNFFHNKCFMGVKKEGIGVDLKNLITLTAKLT
jgi:hypothetical protein